ncbi:MAG: hypothetical protein WC782_10050 [Methylococcaceae bacterium]|jgi:hypothetical protein
MNRKIQLHLGWRLILLFPLLIAGCTQLSGDLPSAAKTQEIKLAAMLDQPAEVLRAAPELNISHYRTLFYGYDTIAYRLAAAEVPENKVPKDLRLLVDARYGGNPRHYALAKINDAPQTHKISLYQHETERCQIFNSLISSCLYRDRFSVVLTQKDLELARNAGLKLTLATANQPDEQLNLPASYVDGFLINLEKK